MEDRDPSTSTTLSSNERGKHSEELLSSTDSAATPHSIHINNSETFERASDVESGRPSLYPVTSYASQIGGEGESFPDEGMPQSEKDPNLVEWDGPNDPANPYNWSIPVEYR